jgi:hypothetical protein
MKLTTITIYVYCLAASVSASANENGGRQLSGRPGATREMNFREGRQLFGSYIGAGGGALESNQRWALAEPALREPSMHVGEQLP